MVFYFMSLLLLGQYHMPTSAMQMLRPRLERQTKGQTDKPTDNCMQGVLPGQASCRVNGLVVTAPGERKPPTRDPTTYLPAGLQ